MDMDNIRFNAGDDSPDSNRPKKLMETLCQIKPIVSGYALKYCRALDIRSTLLA